MTHDVLRMLDEYGRIDVLVNNAGLMPLANIAEADRETLQTTIDVNLSGLVKLTHAVVPTTMVADGSGLNDAGIMAE